jgi:integrase
MARLAGVDLQRATLRDHILPALEKVSGRRHRMVVVKALYSWLRKERHLLTSAEDPTLDLALPQTTPEQWRRSKIVPREHIDLVIEHLTSPWREALTIQAGTGWHTTEVVQFAADGTIEPLPRSALQEGVAGVLVCPLHKSGEPMRTRVSPAVVEAANRLRRHGGISREWYDRAVRAACAAVKRPDGGTGIPVFTPGRLRHSVATWAIEAGADPAQVAAFHGHKSPRTTKRFYATHASPAKVPMLM